MKGQGRVFADIDMSLDGFIAGEGIGANEPLGNGGEKLIWYGDDINDEGVDLIKAYEEVDAQVLDESATREGAVIMGRTTFEVSIGAWGANPPIHKPCFVLTHRPARRLVREGGTTFTFVTSPQDALHQAHRAADGRDVGVMGGAITIRQFLSDGLLDELQLHLVPVLLGCGIRLFDQVELSSLGLRKLSVRDGSKATHLRYQVTRQKETLATEAYR